MASIMKVLVLVYHFTKLTAIGIRDRAFS